VIRISLSLVIGRNMDACMGLSMRCDVATVTTKHGGEM
jgi:hypothetical protein